MMKNASRFCFLVLFISFIDDVNAQIEGNWHAQLTVQGVDLPLVFHFHKGNENAWNGKLDSPKQQAYGIALDRVSYVKDSLIFQSKKLGLSYKGLVNQKEIEGKFTQGTFSTKLKLTRTKQNFGEKTLQRPQEPIPPFSYGIEEVVFSNDIDNVELAGTFTYPKNKKKYPVVVMISGSGAQDRNSEILGHKPFWVVADYLTNNGIGVLRFDDRGTAASQGDFSTATSFDFMKDVYAAVQFLKERDSLKTYSRIGLYGHSEGGLIAPLLASTYPQSVDFLVLLSAPAVPISELMLKQQELVSESSGILSDVIDVNATINKQLYNLLKENENNLEKLPSRLANYFTRVTNEYPQIGKSMGITNKQYVKTMTEAYTHPWMVYFINYVPENQLTKLKLPILALYGGKDLQVSAKENAEKMRSVIAKKNIHNQVITYANLNHLFQNATTGAISEYAEIEETISPKVLEKIKNWIVGLK